MSKGAESFLPPNFQRDHHSYDAHSSLSELNRVESYYQVVAPNLISDFEWIHFFHGVSRNPPEARLAL